MRQNKLFIAFISLFVCFSGICIATNENPTQEEQKADDDKIEWINSDKVIIQGLDKVTGRVFSAQVRLGQKVVFGGLELYIKKALHSPPEEPNESFAFVDIFENRPGENKALIFSGWMIASNPALNPFDHSVYDVWLKETVIKVEAPPAPEADAPTKDLKESEKHEDEEEENID